VDLVEKLQMSEALGREFATWLYWVSFKGNGRVELPGVEPFEVWFESPVELVNDYGEVTSVVLKGGTPLESPEALKAFSENKKIQRTHLRVIFKNQTYTFAFHAGRFLVSGLKLPLPSGQSSSDYLLLRFEILQEFDSFWDSVLERFFEIRFDDKKWRAQRKQISAWIRQAQVNE
jgi:hypothetical protein